MAEWMMIHMMMMMMMMMKEVVVLNEYDGSDNFIPRGYHHCMFFILVITLTCDITFITSLTHSHSTLL